MDPNTYQLIKNNPTLLNFLRSYPQWYRTLSRDPTQLNSMERMARLDQGKTLPQQVVRVSEQLQLLGMLMQMASTMKD